MKLRHLQEMLLKFDDHAARRVSLHAVSLVGWAIRNVHFGNRSQEHPFGMIPKLQLLQSFIKIE